MTRHNRREEHLNHEAWAIPYGDLVTLLMAFFVVMYAVSVVDAGKYSVLSESLIEAFGAPAAVDPIQIGEPTQALNPISEDVRRSLAPVEIIVPSPDEEAPAPGLEPSSPTDVALAALIGTASEEQRGRIIGEIREMAEELQEAMGSLIEAGNIEVKRQPYWIEVSINSNLLFSSGSATLQPAARPALIRVAQLLRGHDVRIHVEGHTDNLPINNTIYPSNWELSSGRAATVVNLFAQNGVDPERMVAIGYGQFHPIDSNATEAGRARNRRVAVIVLPVLQSAQASGQRAPERLKTDLEPG